MTDNVLVDLFLVFSRLSLIAVGGLNTVIPELQREVVHVRGWITAAQLADMIALAQASPGPNGMVVALVGWQVAGLNGFLVSAIAGNVPPAVLAFGLFRVHRKLANTRLLRAAQDGLVPVVVGLILASGVVIAQVTDDTLVEVAMTVMVAVLVWRTRVNPLWMLGASAMFGLTGFYLG